MRKTPSVPCKNSGRTTGKPAPAQPAEYAARPSRSRCSSTKTGRPSRTATVSNTLIPYRNPRSPTGTEKHGTHAPDSSFQAFTTVAPGCFSLQMPLSLPGRSENKKPEHLFFKNYCTHRRRISWHRPPVNLSPWRYKHILFKPLFRKKYRSRALALPGLLAEDRIIYFEDLNVFV